MEYILLPNKNSTWGVHTNPVATNTYKHAYSFDNLNDKIEFVEKVLLDNNKIDDLFKNKASKSWIRKNAVKAFVTIDKTQYPKSYSDEFFLNKDILILKKDDIPGIKYFFYAILNVQKLNDTTFKYELELDIFFTYSHIDYFNKNANVNVIKRHFDAYKKEGNFNLLNYDLMNKTSLTSNEDVGNLPLQPLEFFNYRKIFIENIKQIANIKIDAKVPFAINKVWEYLSKAVFRLNYFSDDFTSKYRNDVWFSNFPNQGKKLDLKGFKKYNYYITASIIGHFKYINSDLSNRNVNVNLNMGRGDNYDYIEDLYSLVNGLLKENFDNKVDAKTNLEAVICQTLIPNASYDLPLLDFINKIYLFNGKRLNINVFTRNVNDPKSDIVIFIKIEKNYGQKDNFPIQVLQLNTSFGGNFDGVKTLNLVDDFNDYKTTFNFRFDLSKIYNGNNFNQYEKFLPKSEPKLLFSPFTKLKLISNYGDYDYLFNYINVAINNKDFQFNFSFDYYYDFQLKNKGYYIIPKNSRYDVNLNNFNYTSLDIPSKINFQNVGQNYLPSYDSAFTDFLVSNYNQYSNSLSKAKTDVDFSYASAVGGALGGIGDFFEGNISGGINAMIGGAKKVTDAKYALKGVQAQATDKKNAPSKVSAVISQENIMRELDCYGESIILNSIDEYSNLIYNQWFHQYGYTIQKLEKWDRNLLVKNRYWFNYIELDGCFENITYTFNNEIKNIIEASYNSGITFWHARRNKTGVLEWKDIKDYDCNNVSLNMLV